MASIEWSPTLETGDDRIDEQHKALIEAFNQLHAALDHSRGWQEVSRTLIFLTNYTVQHFRQEEALMESAKYPDTPRHKKLHHDLVVKLSQLLKRYEEGSATLNLSTLEFLEGWLVEHIQGEDTRVAEHLRSRV